ncbi:MAG: hypothetical protein E7Z89_07880 [Cyanobacteria bacterium SIG28]|nr:hypothetical protein [Cyanobacteria bacterium SIG28]
MSSAIPTIALFAPVMASSFVFSGRRLKRGADAMNNDPIYGLMNVDIAAGQTLKGAKAAQALAMVSKDTELRNGAKGAGEAIKNLSNTNKIMNGIGKVVNFTANNVNPIICGVSAYNVLANSENKPKDGFIEFTALTTMFGFERLGKEYLGMPYTEKVNGNTVQKTREGLYKKNLFISEQVDALNDFCNTKKLFGKLSLKSVPAVGKGLLFVGASIAGYKLGKAIATSVSDMIES